MKKQNMRMGMLIWALVLTMALTACSGTGNKGEAGIGDMDREDEGTLKVAYFDEQAFYMQYGNAFQAMFPNVVLEVVPTNAVFEAEDPVAEMEKLLAEQQPDVVYLTEEQYSGLAKQGQLYDLDAVIKQDEFELDSFQPAVIDLLKARGGGKLYGLSPSFTSMALYYNKDLFDKHGIPYPTDGMSWEQVLQLAARFPAKKQGSGALSGLYPSSQTTDLFELVRTIGEAKGLLYADADAGKVSIDTPDWKPVFQAVVDGYKSGSIAMPSSGEGGSMGATASVVMRGMGGGKAIRFGGDAMSFMSGQAAMAIDSSMMIDFLGMNAGMSATIKSDGAAGDSPKTSGGPSPIGQFEWDLVTLPVDPSQPDVMGGMGLDSVFSINAAAENVNAAWEFIKYVNGEQLAKTNGMSMPALSARTAYKKQADGKNTDAFYALGANEQMLLQTLPSGFAESFAKLASEQLKKVVDGAVSLDDALRTIQSQGQDALTAAGLDKDKS